MLVSCVFLYYIKVKVCKRPTKRDFDYVYFVFVLVHLFQTISVETFLFWQLHPEDGIPALYLCVAARKIGTRESWDTYAR